MQYLPQPDFLESSLPPTHIVLVTNEGSDLTIKLVQQLEKQGNRVVVLTYENPSNNFPSFNKVVVLKQISDSTIQEAVQSIEQQYGKVGTFIQLHPHLEFQNGNFSQHFSEDKTSVKMAFLLAKHLQKSLNELGKNQRANFLTVTRLDGKLGLGKRNNISIVGGGLAGLVKSLNLEWSPVFCRHLDIQPELQAAKTARQIIAELHDANVSHTEVGFSEEGRTTLVAKQVKLKEDQAIQTNITKDSVFLVSGGAKGITATCVIEMAKIFQCKFILLGRSANDIEIPNFAKNEHNEGTLKRLIMNDLKEKGKKPTLPKVKQVFKNIISQKEITHTLNTIKKYGGQATYIKGDVTHPFNFKSQLLAATRTLGTITGIIHGAGRLADKYIQDKSEQDFENVLSVKLDGLLALLSSVNIHQLEHLILFSSVAGFYGNVGQTDYAIANEILSKAAHLFKTNHPNTQVSAINWGAWDSGMVSPELKKQLQAAGVKLVSSKGGAAMLINEFNVKYTEQAQVIIGGTLPTATSYISDDLKTYRIKRHLSLEANPFLNHHVIQGKAVLPVVNAAGWMAQACEKLYPDFRVFKVKHTQLFKGIVFDGNEAENYILTLQETEKSAEKIVFEASILSQGNKLPLYHYKQNVTLIARKEKVKMPTFQPTLSGTYTPTDGTILYQDGSLFHGNYFRGIQQILDWTEQQMLLSCKAPNVPISEQGQFPIQSVNTFFSDIQYQGMVIWVQSQHEGAKSLPLSTDSATIYQPIPFEKELFVHIAILENTAYKMIADCTVYDAAGQVYMVTEGAAVTVSKQLEW